MSVDTAVSAFVFGDVVLLKIADPLGRHIARVRGGGGLAPLDFAAEPWRGVRSVDVRPVDAAINSKHMKMIREVISMLRVAEPSLLIVSGLPADLAPESTVRVEDQDGTEVFHGPCSLEWVEAIASHPAGALVSLMFSAASGLREQQRAPRVSIGGPMLQPTRRYKVRAVGGGEFDRVDFAIPAALFDGALYPICWEIALPPEQILVLSEEWRAPADEIRPPDIDLHLRPHSLPETFPANEIERVGAFMLSRLKPADEQAQAAAGALRALRVEDQPAAAGPGLDIHIFGSTVEEIMQTPAIAQVRAWFGRRLTLYFVLPTDEAVRHSIELGAATRIDQLVEVVTERHLLRAVGRRETGEMLVFLPAGVTLDERVSALIASVHAGDTESVLCAVSNDVSERGLSFAIHETPMRKSSTFGVAAIYSRRNVQEYVTSQTTMHEGVPIQSIRLHGEPSPPFVRRTIGLPAPGRLLREVGVVIDLIEDHADDFGELAGAIDALRAERISVTLFCLAGQAAKARAMCGEVPILERYGSTLLHKDQLPWAALPFGRAPIWLTTLAQLLVLLERMDAASTARILRFGATLTKKHGYCVVEGADAPTLTMSCFAPD